MRWLCSCLLAAAVLAAGALLTRLPGGGARAADRPADGGASLFRGAGSCAAAACHNGGGRDGEKGSEYTTWVLHDPHAQAFGVLYSERSRQIEKNRNATHDLRDHPERDPLCLNCHVMSGVVPLGSGGEPSPHRPLFGADDGVSCEACHGAAGNWLTRHYTDEWRAMTTREKEAAGMTNTKDLRGRAEMCVRCHVGHDDVDVNHDLIAAGHPRLAFELAGFHAKMPKHWDVRKDKEGRPDFEARLWAMGQAMSAKAALDLLAHRADEKNKRPWPEFAEYDCFACHHDIRAQSWRRDRDFRATAPGSLPWGTWYEALVAEAAPGAAGQDVRKALTDLAARMAKAHPDRAEVATQARALGDLFEKQARLAERGGWDSQGIRQRMRQVAVDEPQVSAKSWDGAAQVFLALAALDAGQADLDGRPPSRRLTDPLRAMRRSLEFPPPPRSGAWYDSPRDFCPQEFRGALESFRRGLTD